MQFTEVQLMAGLSAWVWPFLRVTGFVMAAPVIGTRSVPARIKVVLALILSGVLVPIAAPAAAVIDPLAAEGLLTGVHQVVIGAALGLVMRLVFLVFEFAGQLISQQAGLGFASLVDPQTGAQVPVLAHFYILLATLLFFSLDAHLILISLLGESFTLLPVGPQGLTAGGADVIVRWSADLIGYAVVLAMPVVIALLVINLALGVMGRAAPQLNIFAVGFPVMIVFGIGLVFLTLDGLEPTAVHAFDSAFTVARQMLQGG